MKRAYPAHHAVPISKAMRAGDFVFTSAYGPWVFDPLDLVFDDNGVPVGDGTVGAISKRLLQAWSELVGVDIVAQGLSFLS